MKQADAKIDREIISPCGTTWRIIKKYAKDCILIKRKDGLMAVLTGGQFRLFKTKGGDLSG